MSVIVVRGRGLHKHRGQKDKYRSQYPVEIVAGTRLGHFWMRKLKQGNIRAPLALLRDDGLL